MPYGTVNADVIQSSVSGVSLGAGNASSFKNRIINGAMVIDQRNAGAAISAAAASNFVYIVDRFYFFGSQASKFSAGQNAGSVTPPAGFVNYAGLTVDSAYSVAAGDFFWCGEKIEGYNIADLNWGSSNAKTITLSFWVRSSLTGTFGGSLQNNDQSRSYPFTYTISSANTWTQISVTVAGDQTGTWNTTNSIGVLVNFGLGSGSTYSGTANTWQAGNFIQPTSSVSVVGTAGATFYITGLQFEVGSSATGFEYRDYGRELILCQRYAASTFPIGTAWGQNKGAAGCVIIGSLGAGVGYGNQLSWRFPVNMRATPSTITTYNPVAANANARNFGATADRSISALGFSQNGQTSITLTADATGDAVGQALGVHYSVVSEI